MSANQSAMVTGNMPGYPSYDYHPIYPEPTTVQWADFNWVPDTTEPASAFTMQCLSAISGTATVNAPLGASYCSASANAYGKLQGNSFNTNYGPHMTASNLGAPSGDNSTHYVPSSLTGGGGANKVRMIMTIGLPGTAGVAAAQGATASSNITATHSLTSALILVP